MTPCPPPRKWQEYVEDRLSPAEDRSLTEHLRRCSACEEALAQLVAPCSSAGSGERDEPPPPPELVARLRQLGEVAFPSIDPTAPESWPRIEGFEITGVLGRGGTGIVYRARQQELNREVALKVIAAGDRSTPTDARRLLHDAATAAKLRHNHIVPIYAVGRHLGLPYSVMEVLAGGSLAWRVAELVHEPGETARLVATAARALHHAHARGICHRDVKPANILLRLQGPIERHTEPARDSTGPRLADMDACVIDFGLAKEIRAEDGPAPDGAPVGTPGYIAPEQIRSERTAPAVDIYGLGAVLYECLTRRPPFQAETPFDTLLQTLHAAPERPRVVNANVHDELEAICLKCLEKDPRHRYESAATLADALERWRAGASGQTQTESSFGRFWRWCSGRPGTVGLSGPKRGRFDRSIGRTAAGENDR